MSELIDRQAVINALDSFILDEVTDVYGDTVREILERLTTIEERKTGRWIPCSERLPEIGQSVLLSVGGMYSAEGCLREDGDWAQFRWDAIQRKDMVGAWKPLPEPYKGGKE